MKPIKYNSPWSHWIVDDFLSSDCLSELKNIDDLVPQLLEGRRYGSERLFINQSNKELYPNLYKLYESLLNGEYRRFFEEHTGKNFDGMFPRIEVISDIGEFSLAPHTDRKEKLLTAIVYTNHSKLYPGTAISETQRIESKDNRCFFFVPGDDTVHSYPLTYFETVRRCLHINYWTYDE